MGYELIVLALTNNVKALDKLNSNNHVLNTEIPSVKNSKIYSSFSASVLSAIRFREALYYNHRYGLTLTNFVQTAELNEFFELTSYAYDNDHTAFVSTLEGREVPIFVSQFHAEKS